MSLGIDVSAEVRDAFQRLRVSRTPNYTLVLAPNVETLKVDLEHEYTEGILLDDLANKLPSDAPRFVIYLPERIHPDGRKSYPIILVSYCPAGLSPQVNIVYSNSRTEVCKIFQLNQVWDIKKRIMLGDDDLKEKFDTNKW